MRNALCISLAWHYHGKLNVAQTAAIGKTTTTRMKVTRHALSLVEKSNI